MSVAENHPIFSVKVNEAGCLLLPADIAARYGLLPGATVYLDVEANSLRLRRSTAQLSRLYVEPTNFCNLNCTMCIRNAWQEAAGWMSKDVFSQVVEGVRHLPSPPSVCFSGFGEPLSHPAITEMISQIKPFCQQVELITNGTLLNEENSRQLLEAGLDVAVANCRWKTGKIASVTRFQPVAAACGRKGLSSALEDVGNDVRSAAANVLRHADVSLG